MMMKRWAVTSGGNCAFGQSLPECIRKLNRMGVDIVDVNFEFQFWGIPEACYCVWAGDGWSWDFEGPVLIPLQEVTQ